MTRLAAALIVAFVIAQTDFTPRAYGGVIIQPTAASTNAMLIGGELDDLRNQSLLTTGYTNLVTDFDTYMATSPTASGGGPAFDGFAYNVDFNLGGTYTIESFALWNDGIGIKDFELLASPDGTFGGNSISLGTFVASQGSFKGLRGVQVFTFAPTSAAFVRLTSLSDYQGSGFTIINQVAFEQASPAAPAVPEPSSLAVFLAAGAIGMTRRRRAKWHRCG